MVDPTQGTNQYQNIVKTSRTSATELQEKKTEKHSQVQPQDEVVISQEAQDLAAAEAEELASQLRASLTQNPEESLGLDPNFDEGA